ncbi:MAG: glycosyltransferase [Lentisphaeria bacterium]|nr:glycosyltransferase [Lentisphaeria bacterium]
MKISLWTRYSALGASSRLRFLQFIPFLEKAGFKVTVSSFFNDRYLQELYAGKKRSVTAVLNFYRQRKKAMRRTPDGIPALIEYELLPHLPWYWEKGFLSRHPYILNFDDAVDIHYEKIPFLKNKYPQLLRHAAGIIAANDSLLNRFGRYNEHIIKLPTIPPELIVPGKNKPARLTLVWTGTPVTGKFLYERSRALQLAAKTVDFELLIVGSADMPLIPGVNCRCIDWSETAEAHALSIAHAGIMPLPDTAFARGKSAYKLICYLRAGIPGIASPVGENCRVIEHGRNGLLADSDSDWVEALKTLSDPERRKTLAAGAAISGEKFALAPAAEKLAEFIRQSFSGK